MNHSPYALYMREQKNREKVQREIQQWMYCVAVKEQFGTFHDKCAHTYLVDMAQKCSKPSISLVYILSFTTASCTLILRDNFLLRNRNWSIFTEKDSFQFRLDLAVLLLVSLSIWNLNWLPVILSQRNKKVHIFTLAFKCCEISFFLSALHSFFL